MSPETFHPHVLLHSGETGGELSVIRNWVPARWDGPPLHAHDFDETFYVLEGELTFQMEDQLIVAGPGELTFVPRGFAHTLANLSDRPALYLLACTPGGLERYFARVAAEQAGVEPPEWALEPAPEVVRVGPRLRDGLAFAGQAA